MAMHTRKRERCPACGAGRARALAKRTYRLCGPGQDVSQDYALCTRCGTGFAINPPREGDLRRYYATSTQERLPMPEEHELRHARVQADFLDSALRTVWGGGGLEGRSVLEVGPGNGAFLLTLRERAAGRLMFREWNPKAAAHLCNHKGLEDWGRLEAAERPDSVDVVAMHHCLEHVADPAGFLAELRGQLAEGGLLLIEVPDFSLPGQDTDTLLFEHLNYFTLASLAGLLNRCGLSVVRAELDTDREFSECPKRVARIAAGRLPEALARPEERGPVLLEGDGEAERAVRALDAWLETIPPRTRLALAPGSWLTAECLERTRLARFDAAIFDRDPAKLGTRLGGFEVCGPQEIRAFAPDWLLVLNEGFEVSIRADYEALGVAADRIVGWSRFLEEARR